MQSNCNTSYFAKSLMFNLMINPELLQGFSTLQLTMCCTLNQSSLQRQNWYLLSSTHPHVISNHYITKVLSYNGRKKRFSTEEITQVWNHMGWVNNRISIFGWIIPFTLFDYSTNSRTSTVPLDEWSPWSPLHCPDSLSALRWTLLQSSGCRRPAQPCGTGKSGFPRGAEHQWRVSAAEEHSGALAHCRHTRTCGTGRYS